MTETRLTLERLHAYAGNKSVGSTRRKFRAASVPGSSSGRNGKVEREYLLSLLPSDIQAMHAKEMKKGLAVTRAVEQTLPLFAPVPEVQAPRVAVPEKYEEKTRAMLKAIQPLLDFRKRTNGHRPTVTLADGRTVNSIDALAKCVGSQQNPPVPRATLLRWLARFENGGLAALADHPRSDKDKSRFFDEHPAAAAFLQQKFLREGLSRQMAWEAMCRKWKKLGETGDPPHKDTARRYLNALPEPLKVLAREGKEAYERTCSPFTLRGPVPVMDWWVSDHRQFDVLVRNTLFQEMKQDQAYRLWLTAVCDWGSQKIVGFCLAPTPSSRTINSAIRMAVLTHGFLANFYWDNGEDYKKVRRDLEAISLSEGARALLDQYRIGVTSAIPKRPRSKPIESWFGRFSKRFDPLWRPAYLGNKPDNRPEIADESQKRHGKYLAGKRASSPLPTDGEFIVATVKWIEEYNDTRWQPLNGKTPNEVMEEAHPERNRAKVNPRLLDILFSSERERRRVRAGGCVQMDKMLYEPTDESLGALTERQGREVVVLRDPYNLTQAVAADPETLQFVGELRVQEFLAQCPNGQVTRDQINARMRRERGLHRYYAEYLVMLGALAERQVWPTEREALVERALAWTGTDGRALLPAAVPGAGRKARVSVARAMQPAFVSDAVAEDRDIFRDVKLED